MMELSAKRLEQRNRLLRAAYDLVADVGIEGLRTRDIAKRSELNLAIFHYCFGSKDDLLLALYQYIIARFRSETERFLLIDQTPGERLEGLMRLRIFVTQNMGRDLKVWRSFQGLAETNVVVRDILRDHYASQRAIMTGILLAGIESGEFDPSSVGDPAITAGMIVSLQNGLMIQLGLEPGAFDPEKYSSAILKLVVGSNVTHRHAGEIR